MKIEKMMKPFLVSMLLSLFISCSSDGGGGGTETPDPTDDSTSAIDATIWAGATLVFEKDGATDPTLAENQDRISNNVWITRASGGGQIYNAARETEADQDESPVGTLWARGTTANLENLTFDTFRATLDKPKDNVGVDLVMLLVEENIAIDVKFTSWAQQQIGGFAYERSTE